LPLKHPCRRLVYKGRFAKRDINQLSLHPFLGGLGRSNKIIERNRSGTGTGY
jgi:hypothetical protein